MGFSFKGWKETKAVGDGAAILNYLRETAQEFGIDRQIRYQHRVKSASWSSDDSLWTVEAEVGSANEPVRRVRFTCGFLLLCSGYYDYDNGYSPVFEGSADFQGPLVHPQHWPEDLDYRDKRVVVIGSGATAVTLVPALAEKAAHVTMLQRSPTYIASIPSEDPLSRPSFARFCRRGPLWEPFAGRTSSWVCSFTSSVARRLDSRSDSSAVTSQDSFRPISTLTRTSSRRTSLGTSACAWFPMPICFRRSRRGGFPSSPIKSIRFTKHGIQLKSGQELPADIIVTATGLNLLACGGIRISIDGAPVELGRAIAYKGVMLNHVPNCALCVGYTNASWTLRADLSCEYVCRLLNYMERHGYKQCVPRIDEATVQPQPLLGLKSGYVRRGIDHFPKQGTKAPWVFRQNYLYDVLAMRLGALNDGTLVFSKGASVAPTDPGMAINAIDAERAATST